MKGRSWKLSAYGWRPLVSSCFSYQHNQCRSWFDTWLLRGGTLDCDTVRQDMRRATDLPDLRDLGLLRIWSRTEAKLNGCRAELRLKQLTAELKAPTKTALSLVKTR